MDNSENHDIFLIPQASGNHIVYSPLRKIAFKANTSAVNLLHRALSGDKNAMLSDKLKPLISNGLFDPVDESMLPMHFDIQRPPLSAVTISLTYGCNLGCIYCYADAGTEKGIVSQNTIHNAIEFAAKNSKANEYKKLRVAFHGTGEATLVWRKFIDGVTFAEHCAQKYNLISHISLVTNATLISKERANYLAEHNIHVSVSFDGFKSIQNYQRPLRDGTGSFKKVMAGISELNHANVHFAIRATVLPEFVSELTNIVQFFADEVYKNIDGGKIMFEPVEACGRAETIHLKELDADEFAENYMKAWELGEKYGISISSSADLYKSFRQVFCSANGRIFLVLPDGNISSCTRVTTSRDPLSKHFYYGYYDETNSSFILDENRLQSLLSFKPLEREKCKNCFCKWHCGGHCMAASFADDGHWEKMCLITRKLAGWRISQTLEEKTDSTI